MGFTPPTLNSRATLLLPLWWLLLIIGNCTRTTNVLVLGYPNGAGSCGMHGMAAVGGSHREPELGERVVNGSVPIGMQGLIDNYSPPFGVTTILVDPPDFEGTSSAQVYYYEGQIVRWAVSSPGAPFRGILIRMQAADNDALFLYSLDPTLKESSLCRDVNATGPNVQGLTHVDNSDKEYVSGYAEIGRYIPGESDRYIYLDVTVVYENGKSASRFGYKGITIKFVRRPPKPAPVPKPTPSPAYSDDLGYDSSFKIEAGAVFGIVAFAAFMCCCYWRYPLSRRRPLPGGSATPAVRLQELPAMRAGSSEAPGTNRQPGTVTDYLNEMSPSARQECIANVLKTDIYMADDQNNAELVESDRNSCAICLDSFKNGDEICSSNNENCQHNFHRHCAYEWLLNDPDAACPCCRRAYLDFESIREHLPLPEAAQPEDVPVPP